MKIPQHKLKYLDKIGDQTELKDITIKGWLGSGFADKHGDEIFEGHIVTTPWDAAAVEWQDCGFMVEGCDLASFASSDLEIIGHIAERDES